MEARRQKKDTFKVLNEEKKKKIFQSGILYAMKIYFKHKGKETFADKI